MKDLKDTWKAEDSKMEDKEPKVDAKVEDVDLT